MAKKRSAPFTVAKIFGTTIPYMLYGVIQFYPVLGGFKFISHVPGRTGSRKAYHTVAQALPKWLPKKTTGVQAVLPD